MIFIHCKQAVDFVSKREELKLSRMEVMQLRLHLFICAGCRRFVKQNAYVVKAMKRYGEKQDGKGLTEGDRDRIVRGMVE
jgi:hypothetical protein